ncbi:MAG: hypothetical protein AAGC65_22885 [Mucilaginibacter sp.]
MEVLIYLTTRVILFFCTVVITYIAVLPDANMHSGNKGPGFG